MPRTKNARDAKQTALKVRSTTMVATSSGEVVRTARSTVLASRPRGLRPYWSSNPAPDRLANFDQIEHQT